ncbi:MAG: hypothetical protein QHJ73_17280, partial [Armatimonadota bacterium]|nr:hypothetical protein [Armatimonadota bacterium]
GKARMGMDLLLPRGGSAGAGRGPGAGTADESLGDFVRRRLGREALERIAAEIPPSEELTYLLQFLKEIEQGRHGRQLDRPKA